MERSNTAVRRLAVAGGLLAVILSAGACEPGPTPPPTPPATPTTTTQPTATPTPTPSQSSSAEVRKAEYDKAVTASAHAITEANRLIDESAVKYDTPLPNDLAKVADPAGTYYQRQSAGLDVLHREGWKYTAVTTVTSTWASTRLADFTGTALTMYVCIDGRAASVVDRTGRIVDTGRLLHGALEVARTPDGTWRVTNYAAFEGQQKFLQTEKCLEPGQ